MFAIICITISLILYRWIGFEPVVITLLTIIALNNFITDK